MLRELSVRVLAVVVGPGDISVLPMGPERPIYTVFSLRGVFLRLFVTLRCLEPSKGPIGSEGILDHRGRYHLLGVGEGKLSQRGSANVKRRCLRLLRFLYRRVKAAWVFPYGPICT